MAWQQSAHGNWQQSARSGRWQATATGQKRTSASDRCRPRVDARGLTHKNLRILWIPGYKIK
jgi:hypothetical protein